MVAKSRKKYTRWCKVKILKHYDNRQSAAKPEKESSTTIPREGSTIQAIGIGSGFA